jgi:hypothetical protein
VSVWVLGEFGDKEGLLQALRGLKAQGVTRMDTYTPYPVDEVSEILALPKSGVRWMGLFGGLFGAGLAYFVEWYCNAFDFPIVVGGRPFHSFPAFIPITFESMVLFSSLAIFFSALAHFGMPRVDHPLFRIDAFEGASIDQFWLSVTTEGGSEEVDALKSQLESLGARLTSVLDEDAR